MTAYFDAYTVAGPRAAKHPAEPWRLEEIVAEMDHCAIAQAMVLSTQAIQYDLQLGNRRLSEALEPYHGRLHAIWNAIPHASREFPAPATLFAAMEEHGVRAVSLHPLTNGWDLFDRSSEALLGGLQERQAPVYLPRSQFHEFNWITRLMEKYRRLILIVPGINWAEQRYLLPLLERYPGLHITFDHLQINEGIEDLVELGLENQLLFGSNAPKMSMGAHRCFIDYAEVPREVIGKIAGGNLRRLLGGLPERHAAPPAEDDAIMQAARKGEPLPVPLIDMHMHILEEGSHGGGGSFRMKNGGPNGVLRLLTRLGCSGGGLMSWNGTVSADSAAGNRTTAEALKVFPSGFWGLGTFDPSHYTPEEMLPMIEELYADPRWIGMKPYAVYGIPYDDPLYAPWWAFGNERGYYALIHRTRDNFSEVTTLAERWPNVQWVVAHCGASFKVADQCIEAIRAFPNIHAEITYTPVCLGIIEYLVKGCGAERVLYGSDLPMRDPRQQLGWVIYSRLPVEEKALLLGGNANRLVAPLLARAENLSLIP